MDEPILTPPTETPAPDGAPAPTPTPDAPANPWYHALPADKHEALAAMSPEDAAAAIERGAAYKPAASVDEITLDDVDMFPGESIASFKELAVKSGMTVEQAKQSMDFYKQEKARLDSEFVAENTAALKQEWGAAYPDNVKAAEKAVAYFESKLGGVKDAVAAGLHSNAAFVKIMAQIGKSLSEPDASGGTHGGEEVAIPPEQFYGQFHKSQGA